MTIGVMLLLMMMMMMMVICGSCGLSSATLAWAREQDTDYVQSRHGQFA